MLNVEQQKKTCSYFERKNKILCFRNEEICGQRVKDMTDTTVTVENIDLGKQ